MLGDVFIFLLFSSLTEKRYCVTVIMSGLRLISSASNLETGILLPLLFFLAFLKMNVKFHLNISLNVFKRCFCVQALICVIWKSILFVNSGTLYLLCQLNHRNLKSSNSFLPSKIRFRIMPKSKIP